MNSALSLSNHFLIAMPNLADPNFSRTVTLICEHSSEGAMGITINRLLSLTLGDILTQLNINTEHAANLDMPIYQGGPVQNNRGFVLHEPLGNWESTLSITETLGVSTSLDILAATAGNQGPARCLVTLGYAGWAPGQLEEEIAANAWLNGPADSDIIFHTPIDQRWQAAVQRLGVDLATLSTDTGHA